MTTITRLFSGVGWAVTLLLASAIGLLSLRYALPTAPQVPPNVGANLFAHPSLIVHAVTASVALLLGPWQFLRRRDGRRGLLHRLLGSIYVAACLIGGAAGLVLAFGSTAGPIATAGFGTLALAWLFTTMRGLLAVLRGRYADHRTWMVRSFALTFAAVTLRIYLPLSMAMGLDPTEAYRAISFLCWVPNLLAAEGLMAFAPPARRLPGAVQSVRT